MGGGENGIWGLNVWWQYGAGSLKDSLAGLLMSGSVNEGMGRSRTWCGEDVGFRERWGWEGTLGPKAHVLGAKCDAS